MRRTGVRPSPALVVAAIALVAALAGTAVAEQATTSAKPVTKKQVKKIAKKQINKQFPIGSDQIEDGAVTSSKIAGGAVDSSKLGDAAVQTGKIANAAVTEAKIAPAALQHQTVVRTFLANTAGAGTLGEANVNCDAGELLVGGGGGWVNNANPPTSYVLDGTVSDSGPSTAGDAPIADGTAPQFWHVSGVNTSGGNARMFAYAVCLT